MAVLDLQILESEEEHTEAGGSVASLLLCHSQVSITVCL
ncbi:SapB/AmfS family lanthipeptide [Streptomyces sp. NPDC048483]